jgi:hypothetical protein
MTRYQAPAIGWGLHRATLRLAAQSDAGLLEQACDAWLETWTYGPYRTQLSREWFLYPLAAVAEATSISAFLVGDIRATSEVSALGLPDPIEHRAEGVAALFGLSSAGCTVDSRQVVEPDAFLRATGAIARECDSFAQSIEVSPALPPRLAGALLDLGARAAQEFAFAERIALTRDDRPRWHDERTMRLPFPISAGDLCRGMAVWIQAFWLDERRFIVR